MACQTKIFDKEGADEIDRIHPYAKRLREREREKIEIANNKTENQILSYSEQ